MIQKGYSTKEVRIQGRDLVVPVVKIDKQDIVVVKTNLMRVAYSQDEWLQTIQNPDDVIETLKKCRPIPDLFHFRQPLSETEPRYSFKHLEYENFSILPITTYSEWLSKQIVRQVRNKINKSNGCGVVVKEVPFDDVLVKGISEICNESPIRQGKKFWHYQKDLNAIYNMTATFLDKSKFIGAYWNDELIGFIKLTFGSDAARPMQILAKIKHRDKAPTNALIAKAVEICAEKGMRRLVYGQFTYGKKGVDSLSVFKKDMGFKSVDIPRYYVPLTLKGRLLLQCNLHKGLVEALPACAIKYILSMRLKYYQRKYKL